MEEGKRGALDDLIPTPWRIEELKTEVGERGDLAICESRFQAKVTDLFLGISYHNRTIDTTRPWYIAFIVQSVVRNNAEKG